ncbi:glycosyltransferase family 92 protein At1g27200 [Euphorbia lathyris]|uniref:glycosyltransferase family 92 protein At1g27200 n=1 Tax=Euphorbia lathyris TaxID=212925 RepID=UPI00331389C8
MNRRKMAALLFSFISVVLVIYFSLYSSHNPTIYLPEVLFPSPGFSSRNSNIVVSSNLLVQDSGFSPIYYVQGPNFIPTVSILCPDWEVLVIVAPEKDLGDDDDFTCVYPNRVTAPASFSGILPSTNRTTFKCDIPKAARRRTPFYAPVLKRSSDREFPVPWPSSPPEKLIRYKNVVYESFSTEDDVVVFVKGLNNRQGVNRSPAEFNCVFTDGKHTVLTAVTSSIQEVFRCHHPEFQPAGKVKVSIEILEGKKLVPSVAYYTPYRRKIAISQQKHQMCATTMVYNVAKFLREWVTYHSTIGVDKFILYDNQSDDDLQSVVTELNEEGFDIETFLWIWPKTQEAGFSHAALLANNSCKWMMYADVDEFIFSPSWENSTQPDHDMIDSLLKSIEEENLGELSIKCNEFGPSNQQSHPSVGVMQGYNCRRRFDNRHKSIVLLKAIDYSLLNAVHHFQVNRNYTIKKVGLETAVVNHYKYQAWPEFKAKFRRRVSAYVVDWRRTVNPLSQDRAPGLGFEAVEPPGWESKFCEVIDERLKLMTETWFGMKTETGLIRMPWQS